MFETCSEGIMVVRFIESLKHRDFISTCIGSGTTGFTLCLLVEAIGLNGNITMTSRPLQEYYKNITHIANTCYCVLAFQADHF